MSFLRRFRAHRKAETKHDPARKKTQPRRLPTSIEPIEQAAPVTLEPASRRLAPALSLRELQEESSAMLKQSGHLSATEMMGVRSVKIEFLKQVAADEKKASSEEFGPPDRRRESASVLPAVDERRASVTGEGDIEMYDRRGSVHRRSSGLSQLSGISGRMSGNYNRALTSTLGRFDSYSNRRRDAVGIDFGIFSSDIHGDSYEIRRKNTLNRTGSQLCERRASVSLQSPRRMSATEPRIRKSSDFTKRQPGISVAYRRNSNLEPPVKTQLSTDFESGFAIPPRQQSRRLSVSCRPARLERLVT